MKICSLDNFQEDVKNITKLVRLNQKTIQPFVLLSLINDAFLHKQSSEIYVEEFYPLIPILGDIPKHPRREKIRIGYFSADFRDNPSAYLSAELFELHDKNNFELIAFSFGSNDNSPIRLRVSKAFDQFIDVQDMSDEGVARLSRELEIDIAVNFGAAFAEGSRVGIFSYRAAPIQVNYFTTSTLGATYMDYILSDKTVIPESSKHFYSEKLIYLPNAVMVDDSQRIASKRTFSKQECGLPEDVFIFCSFNNHYKHNPYILDLWARILIRVDQSVLWITYHNAQFSKNITAEFAKRGIDRSRLIFATRTELMADHLARYPLADLFLDSYPFTAQTTALDALKTGLPLLTLQGESLCSRMASSLLKTIGLPELITTTQEEYEFLAIELATNPSKLANIKQRLVENRSTTPLFDTPVYTKHLELAYKTVMERYWADLPLDDITIV